MNSISIFNIALDVTLCVLSTDASGCPVQPPNMDEKLVVISDCPPDTQDRCGVMFALGGEELACSCPPCSGTCSTLGSPSWTRLIHSVAFTNSCKAPAAPH